MANVGLVLYAQGRGKEGVQKSFETAPSSTMGSAKLLESPEGAGREESVQKLLRWEAQAGRDKVLGGFSAKRGAAGTKHMTLS